MSADVTTTSATVVICCYTHERWDDLQTAIGSVRPRARSPRRSSSWSTTTTLCSTDSVRRSRA